MADVRSLKKVCSLLHEIRRTGGHSFYSHVELDKMIESAEEVYHNEKENR